MNKIKKQSISILVIGFLVRFIGAGITTITSLNPDSTGDAIGFGNHAQAIARGILIGQPYLYVDNPIRIVQFLFPLTSVDTYTLWGTFLSPFWLLPGPSGFYARLGSAFFGAFAIYNVYLLAQHYHSHQAGVIAVIPMIFYPSIVAIHSTLLREAFVLFGITTATRLLVLPLRQHSRWFSYGTAVFLLHLVLLQREDNAIIVAAAIGIGVVTYAVKSGYISRRTAGIGAGISPITFVLSLPTIQDGIEFLAYTRRVRASGRVVYLPKIIPGSIIEFMAFSWVGAAYFLYAPFPWMINTVPDLLVGIEGLVNIAFTFAAIWGVRSLGQKNLYATVGLLVGLAIAVVLYGVGTVNYGTGVRHRQMFLWVIFLFGGIGISEHVKLVWKFCWGRDTAEELGTNSISSESD